MGVSKNQGHLMWTEHVMIPITGTPEKRPLIFGETSISSLDHPSVDFGAAFSFRPLHGRYDRHGAGLGHLARA